MASSRDIVLFHYSFSTFSKRVIWYLDFRQIPYTECVQPHVMPRPDIAALGVSYRRIPILSIGRDIYNDTRLILQKLESLFPPSPQHPSISAPSPASLAIQKLLEFWTIDGGVFIRGAQLIPTSSPILRDRKFLEDRQQFTGGAFMKSLEEFERGRPEAVVEMKGHFEFLEGGLLADGREWILGSEKPLLADIEGAWMFVWVKSLPGALPPDQISPSIFPKTFAWIERFENYAKSVSVKPVASLKGPEAAKKIENSEYAEPEGNVDEKDPTGLKKAQEIEVWPIESGMRNKDRGKLLALNSHESVIESKTQNGKTVRIHAPRHGFRIAPVDASKL